MLPKKSARQRYTQELDSLAIILPEVRKNVGGGTNSAQVVLG